MITERTLKRWRRDALVYNVTITSNPTAEISRENEEFRRRILRLTQELSDLLLTTYQRRSHATDK